MTAATVQSWQYRLHRLAPGDERKACFAPTGHVQPCSRNSGVDYRCEAISGDTGEVRTSFACVNHAAWLASRVGIPFPLTGA